MRRDEFKTVTLPTATHTKVDLIREKLLARDNVVGKISMADVINMLADFYSQRTQIKPKGETKS